MGNTKKRFRYLAAAAACAFALAAAPVPAEAIESTDRGSITLNNIETGVEVNTYKVIDVNYDFDSDQPESPTYTWASGVQSWVRTNYDAYITVDGDVSSAFDDAKILASEKAAFYDAMAAAIANGTITLTPDVTTSTGEGTQVDDLEMGGYLLIIENGNYVYRPVAESVSPAENEGSWVIDSPTVDTKRSHTGIEKTVEDVELVGAQIGDLLNYDLVSDVPSYPANATAATYLIADRMSVGLTYQPSSLKVYGVKSGGGETLLSQGTDYTVGAKDLDNADVTFALTFDGRKLTTAGYTKIHVEYQAMLNGNAPVGPTGNPNEAKLQYSNNPYDNTSHKTIPDEGKVYTYGIELFKVNDKDDALGGAQFTISKSQDGSNPISCIKTGDGIYRVATNDDSTGDKVTTLDVGAGPDVLGELLISGLDEGTYYLTEITAPSGYTKPVDPFEFVIKDADGSGVLDGVVENESELHQGYVTGDVVNTNMFVLPTTGGTGTVAFVAAGVVLLGTGAAIIVKLRRSSAHNA